MIDHHHLEEQPQDPNTNPLPSNSSTIQQSSAQTIQLKKQTNMPQLLKSYVKQSISIHRQRLERVEQCNQILAKQYRALDTDLDKLKENKGNFNKELDAMILMLKEVDRVEAGVMECERNGKLIMDLIGQIEKKITQKLQKKIQNLEKLKKNKK